MYGIRTRNARPYTQIFFYVNITRQGGRGRPPLLKKAHKTATGTADKTAVPVLVYEAKL